MIFWVDAQLPPALAKFLETKFGVEAVALRELGLRDAEDTDIFAKARSAGAIVISKDADFVEMVERLGAPPQLLWVTCGNVTNERLQEIFSKVWPDVIALLENGEPIVEVAQVSNS